MALDLDRIRLIIFDVLGTVVDDAGCATAEFEATIREITGKTGRGAELATGWLRHCDERTRSIAAGRADWLSMDDINYDALVQAAAERHLDLPEPALRRLAGVQQRMIPWPDSVPALRSMSRRYPVVALSNASLATLAEMSRHGSLPWNCVLSGELVHSYKPDPAVYAMALRLLRATPDETLFAAAHPWDLGAAAATGIRTAYITRSVAGGAPSSESFTLTVDDLNGLAERMSAEPPHPVR
ncbi:haloacid dehalogenase type II [Micromonospora sp. NBC_01796]|uniref:haloacid dehalogenase type II n=1 Tax=Micromonospora sp. NBC_01796 TaxID=2975987 RepID=UPI002DD81D42|nr:haloacid dehalogenase type II [Micromonospora sp. NBC_01796]WSA83899.1 haloacid dehalogenase type II [Micromonospora sp. NBC_01796]